MQDEYGHQCHLYSLPYEFNTYLYLNNVFKGNTSVNAPSLTIYDIDPFEHDLFEKVSQNFPFHRTLCVPNSKQQWNRQHWPTLIIFAYLVELNILF